MVHPPYRANSNHKTNPLHTITQVLMGNNNSSATIDQTIIHIVCDDIAIYSPTGQFTTIIPRPHEPIESLLSSAIQQELAALVYASIIRNINHESTASIESDYQLLPALESINIDNTTNTPPQTIVITSVITFFFW